MDDNGRWWAVEVSRSDNRGYIGRVECTRAELREHLGPYVSINENGRVIVFGKPSRKG
jgi:hypothetical protein